MHVIRRGTGSAILFIHGMPTNSELWRGVIDRVCGEFTCFAVDLPGFGLTPNEPPQGNYLASLAQQIDGVRAAYDIKRWHIVAHDAGTAVAVQYTHQYPQSVQRMVLLSPALFPDLRPYFLLDWLRRPVLGEVSAPAIASVFWYIAMRRAVVCEEGTPGPSFRAFQQTFRGMSGGWRFMRVMRWGEPAEVLAKIPSYLAELRAPTSVLYGTRDVALPAEMAHRTAAAIPSAQLVPVDSGHFIPLNRPGFVASFVSSWLQQAQQSAVSL